MFISMPTRLPRGARHRRSAIVRVEDVSREHRTLACATPSVTAPRNRKLVLSGQVIHVSRTP